MTTADDLYAKFSKMIEDDEKYLTKYQYLDLKIKLTYLMRIEEQLDAIRLCLIEGNNKK